MSKDDDDCGNHGDGRRKLIRRLFAGALILLFLVLLAILIVWLVLQPSKPDFTLQDATVYAFNVSSPPIFLTSTIQVTLSSRNPNSRIGIYYDSLAVYATYRSQQITPATAIVPTYQGHHDLNVFSPFLYAVSVPIAPYIGVALNQDQSSGMIMLLIKANGRLRWKVGSFISQDYHLHVNCPAYISLGSSAVGAAVKYQLAQSCSVNV